MAEELIGGAILGVVFQEVYRGGVCLYKVFNGSARKEFEETVNKLLPVVKKICEEASEPQSGLVLQKFQQFHDAIEEGNRLVDEYQKSCICFRSFKIANRVKKLEMDINEFFRNEQPIIATLQQIQAQKFQLSKLETVIYGLGFQSTQLESVIQGQNSQATQMDNLGRDVKSVLQRIEQEHGQKMEILLLLVEKVRDAQISQQDSQSTQLQKVPGEMETVSQISEEDESFCHPPDPPRCLVGFDDHMMELKKLVLEQRMNVVGIAAMSGAGKSALAKAFCNDDDIKEYFKRTIIYIIASQRLDLLSILKEMWKYISREPAPHFTNVDDAHNKLQFKIKSIKSEPILVVLDDVWPEFHAEKLLFEGEQYTTLVTTRDKKVIPEGPKTRVYDLPLLQQEYALSLFCYYAFEESTIPNGRNKELVMKVQQQCKGLPLALQVLGSSLNGKSDSLWEGTEKALSIREPFKDHPKDSFLNVLKTNIDVLDEEEKQCFLDLAVFPKGRTIPANVLLDIWVYVRRMKQVDAIRLLRTFEASHLLDLKRDPGTPGNDADDSMNNYSISLHDGMRDLALLLANQDNEIRFSRLYMSQKQSQLPPEWQKDKNHLSKAQIVSIYTGEMKDRQWPGMEFPEAEALVLYFTATDYCIPTFLHTMKNLKVLIIHNDHAKRAKLSGPDGFQTLSQLKTLHLERLILPEECKLLNSLEKISLSVCGGIDKDKMLKLPALLEFYVDSCNDLEELSSGIYSSMSMEIFSIARCRSFAKLPHNLHKFESLKVISLCESPGLKELSRSICSLTKLEFLNISSCKGLKESAELKKTIESIAKMPSLKKVICDKKHEQLFKSSSTTGQLVVETMEEDTEFGI